MAIDKHILFILGMHRSGASAVARMLSLLGADLGQNPGGGSSRFRSSTASGQAGCLEINENILADLDSTWFDTSSYPAEWWQLKPFERYKNQVKELIDSRFPSSEVAALRDPLLCRLFPFWLDTLKLSGRKISAVLVVRHPDEVVASIRAESPLTEGMAYLLWAVYQRDAERATRDLPRIVIQYQQLLDDWRHCSEMIAEGTGIAWHGLNDASARKISQEIDHNLRHHYPVDDADGSEIRQFCLQIWKQLTAGKTPDTPRINKLWTELEKHQERLLNKLVLDLNQELIRQTERHEQQSDELEAVSKQHQMNQKNLAELLEKVDALEQVKQQAQKDLEQKEQQIFSLDDSAQQARSEIDEQTAQITELREANMASEKTIGDKARRIDELSEANQQSQATIEQQLQQIADLNNVIEKSRVEIDTLKEQLQQIESRGVMRSLFKAFNK